MSNTEVFPDPDQWTPGNPYEWVVDIKYPTDPQLDNYGGSNLYLVSATAGAGGSASCSVTSVASGGNSTCTATASAGYQFNSWTGACAGQGACSLTNITSDQTSGASFEPLDGDGDGIISVNTLPPITLFSLIGTLMIYGLRRIGQQCNKRESAKG